MLVISDASLSPAVSTIVLLTFWLVFSLLLVREWRAQQAAAVPASLAVGRVLLLAVYIDIRGRGGQNED